MSEQSKIDAERAAFESAVIKLQSEWPFNGIGLNKREDGSYVDPAEQAGWLAWQARASLPVGVPDAWRDALQKIAKHAPPVNCAAKTEVEKLALIAVHALIAFSAPQFSQPTDHQSEKVGTAAPTVKAEQPDCVYCQGHGEVMRTSGQTAESYSEHNEECPECQGTGLAPSLPAAVSADQPYQDGIAEDLERSDWTPIEALQWYAAGKHFDTVGGRTRIIDTGAVASNALKHASLDYLELKGDAELSELRAALSAQQSAPERVSVPVEVPATSAQLHEALLKVRGSAINARECIGGIRQGQNVTSSELWGACEHLDLAITCASAAIKGVI